MFEKVKKNFGFGLMRLPMADEKLDFEQVNQMADLFMSRGFNYFDTAKGYLSGQSEVALRECVVKRFPRESFAVADKLTENFFNTNAEIFDVFQQQLQTCGVEYFDFYLMHAQSSRNYEKYQACKAYEAAQELKNRGKIRHVGLSFHDTAEFLDKILHDHPEVEFVQIQLNYADFDDVGVQSRKCLEVCRKHEKPVIVMEPVKGGNLINLPKDANDILQNLNGGSNASYAIRFAASQPGVFMVLSGMGNMQQMTDNATYMRDFVPINEAENNAIRTVCDILKKQKSISCTACHYCTEGCPKKIAIPDLFADFNEAQNNDWHGKFYYNIHTQNGRGRASDCVKCGKCEKVCPQKLPIRELLQKVAKTFENN